MMPSVLQVRRGVLDPQQGGVQDHHHIGLENLAAQADAACRPPGRRPAPGRPGAPDRNWGNPGRTSLPQWPPGPAVPPKSPRPGRRGHESGFQSWCFPMFREKFFHPERRTRSFFTDNAAEEHFPRSPVKFAHQPGLFRLSGSPRLGRVGAANCLEGPDCRPVFSWRTKPTLQILLYDSIGSRFGKVGEFSIPL